MKMIHTLELCVCERDTHFLCTEYVWVCHVLRISLCRSGCCSTCLGMCVHAQLAVPSETFLIDGSGVCVCERDIVSSNLSGHVVRDMSGLVPNTQCVRLSSNCGKTMCGDLWE